MATLESPILLEWPAVSESAPAGASSDTALVAAAQAGDRVAFGQLYDRYARLVHGILLSRVPYAEVDDLVQDVFLRALRQLPSLRDAALFRAWLAAIARNRANDFYRRLRPVDELPESLPARGSLEEAEARAALEAIRSLPEAYRETLILRLVEGMTGVEIAAHTGLTHGSVRVNLHRGMKALRGKTGRNDMSDNYLWDKTGEPDPEVERLEKLLGRYRHQPRRIDWTRISFLSPARWRWLAAAAILVLAVGAGLWMATRPSVNGWEVVRLEGSPQVGAASIERTAKLRTDEWLETGPDGRARLESAIGAVEVEPNTRLRLRRAQLTEHRLEMSQGTIHAHIWAPPRLFFVETPSAVAVDLGCQYTLRVDFAGAGRVDVTSGWVAFESNGREAFIPAEGACHTRPGVGPGTPFFGDSSEKFRAALEQLDFGPPESSTAVLQTVLSEARPRDALSLWHLLARGNPDERALVYDRLAQLVPPPAGVTRDGILRGDRRMLDLWWDALGYGEAGWFRLWKRDLPR